MCLPSSNHPRTVLLTHTHTHTHAKLKRIHFFFSRRVKADKNILTENITTPLILGTFSIPKMATEDLSESGFHIISSHSGSIRYFIPFC